MFCKKCGNQLNESATFCNKCGNAVAGGVPTHGTAVITRPRSNKKPIVLVAVILVVLLAISGLAFWGIQETKAKEMAAEQEAIETAIQFTLQSYSDAISTLDFKRADSYCEASSQSLFTAVLNDVPFGNTIATAIAFIGELLPGQFNYSMTVAGEITVTDSLATAPIRVSISVAESLFPDVEPFSGTGQVVLVKTKSDSWTIRSIEIVK